MTCPHCTSSAVVILSRHPTGGLLVECEACRDWWIEKEKMTSEL